MKKIFTLMLTLACAMFVSVSCSTDATTDGEGVTPPAEEVVGDAVTFDALDVLGYEAGTLNLAYTVNVERDVDDRLVPGEPTAAWLKVATPEDAEDYVILTWDKNNNSPNSPAREASFTATFGDNAPVTVTVKQASTTVVSFEVDYGDLSPTMALPIVHPADLNMTWGYLTASESAFAEWDATTPQEYINNYVAGQLEAQGLDFWSWVFNPSNVGCSVKMQVMANRQSNEKVYLFVAGGNVETETVMVDSSWGSYEETKVVSGAFTTPFHIYELKFLPIPAISVVGGLSHSAMSNAHYAGMPEEMMAQYITPNVLTVNIENPLEDGELQVEDSEDWASTTVEKVDNATYKVSVLCAPNVYALSRKVELTLSYGNESDPYGSGYLMFTPYDRKTVTFTQFKNDDAVVPKVSVALAEGGNQFNKFVVNTTIDDESAYYVVGASFASEVREDRSLADVVSYLISSSYNRPTYYQGNQENIVLQLNCNNMKYNGKDFYVYVCPVDAENHKLLTEPTYIEVTVDESKKPVLEWVVTEDMKWNEEDELYELYVEPGTELTLSYTLNNPVEDGVVKTVFSDYNQVFVQNATVVNAEAKTVTFTLDAYHANKNNHHAEISLKYAHVTDSSWYWEISSKKIRVIHKAPAETPAN